MSDFADATSTPANSSSSIVTPRASDNMRTLIDMHKKRVLPTPHLHQQPQSLQRNNGANAAELPSNSHSHLHGGGMDSATSSLPSPATTASSISAGNMHTQASGELSNLFGSLQAKKKSLQQHHHASAYTDRNNGNGPIVSSHAGGLAAARSASNLLNASSSNSSINQASTSTTSSQQVLNSGFASTSSHHSHATSSSQFHVSTSEMKQQALRRDLSNLKSSMSEMDALASTQKSITNLQKKLRASMENLIDGPSDTEQLVTFPDDDVADELSNGAGGSGGISSCGASSELMLMPNGAQLVGVVGGGQLCVGNAGAGDTVKFEEKRTTSASKCKVITDGFSSEQATSNSTEMKHLQTGDVDYKEETAAAAVRKKIEVDGVTAEQNAAALKEARTFKSGDVQQQESNNRAASHTQIHSDTFSAKSSATAQAQQRQTVTASGLFSQEQNFSSSSQSNYTMSSSSAQHHQGISTAASSMIGAAAASNLSAMSNIMNGSTDGGLMLPGFEDLEQLGSNHDVEAAIQKYGQILDVNVKSLQSQSGESKSSALGQASDVLDSINQVMKKAWSVPTYGHQLGDGLCNTLRNSGGLDLLVSNCVGQDFKAQIPFARLLEQCLTTENRSHVVKHGLEKVVNVACVCTAKGKTQDASRVGTGILEHMFKHSEGTCSDVIKLGGLDAVLFECRKNDVETLRHCAMALANLSLYGGAENQEAMINRKVPMWLFPLAFHNDDNIKYYACLAIAVLVANKEIEAEVLKSGTLDLVEPFVTSHNPSEFAKSNLAHAHGQSKHWLARLVPVLSSNREEARNLAAFHFCMEAGIKKEQQKTDIFREIGAVEPLKVVASCPNAVASKFAAQALRLIGEEVPHKLSQQVPLWTVEDVREWVKQIGFNEYEQNFSESRVDGDLLLQLNDENIREDIGIGNGIRRRRFRRELENLKKMADYSSKDVASLNTILQNIGPEFSIYTYTMLNAGVDKESLKNITESQLVNECGITNSIHRQRILNSLRCESTLALEMETSAEKTLDVFVSYRRSNGSQLASLLKVHLQLRGFTVFIDVERLEAGKFDNNLLNSIKQAKHFILVLTPNTLDRCINDVDCKDWVHREIVAAITSECNIIPIIDNFSWPEAEVLPDDMRSVCHFNAVRWIHDYQDACVDKLERFMRGERTYAESAAISNLGSLINGGSTATPTVLAGTPSSYFGIQRQHPPTIPPYQRMHSNESDKDSVQITGNNAGGPTSLGSGRSGD